MNIKLNVQDNDVGTNPQGYQQCNKACSFENDQGTYDKFSKTYENIIIVRPSKEGPHMLVFGNFYQRKIGFIMQDPELHIKQLWDGKANHLGRQIIDQ